MIKLSIENGIWIADYTQASNASEIYSLFGSYHLPTAYTAQSSAAKVLAAVQALNDETVILTK